MSRIIGTILLLGVLFGGLKFIATFFFVVIIIKATFSVLTEKAGHGLAGSSSKRSQ